MPVIYCQIQLFVLSQEIYMIKPDGEKKLIAKAPLDYIANALASLCYEKEIFKIHLFGLNKIVEPIVEDIKTKENILFSESKIEIEVNK